MHVLRILHPDKSIKRLKNDKFWQNVCISPPNSQNNIEYQLISRFSKKAAKIVEIFTVDLTLFSKCQIEGEDFVNFLAFLENTNFNSSKPENLALRVKLFVFLIKKNFHFGVKLKIK